MPGMGRGGEELVGGGCQAGWPPERNSGLERRLLVPGRGSDAGAGPPSSKTRRKSHLPEHPTVSTMLSRL